MITPAFAPGECRAQRCRDALGMFQETFGKDHPRVGQTASILADAHEGKGNRAQAERMFRLAMAIDERAYGSGIGRPWRIGRR